jgi:hypothetical protein
MKVAVFVRGSFEVFGGLALLQKKDTARGGGLPPEAYRINRSSENMRPSRKTPQ